MKTFFHKYQSYLPLILMVLLLQALNVHSHEDEILARSTSFDYDGYWHLLRVQEIHRSGSWDNEINLRGNAPFGERLHWTHAMDLVLWTGATIGSLFADFDSSLYWWGVFVGPVFYVLSLIAMILLGRTLLGPKCLRLPGLLFIANIPQLFVVYSVNRPDHHCLVAFVYVLCYGSFLILLERPQSTAVAVLVGLAGAVGLWCSLELLVLVGLAVLYLGLLWLIRGEKYLKANRLLALALSVGLMIIMLLDNTSTAYLERAYDRASIVHAGMFFLVFMFWLGESLVVKTGLGTTLSSRVPMALGGAVPVLFTCQALFPQFVNGPMARVDPRLYALYLSRTGEFGMMWQPANLPFFGYSVLLVGPALIYLVWAMHQNHDRKVVFAWLALTIGAYSVLAVTMGRWMYTLAFTGIMPTAFALIALWRREDPKRNPIVAFVATIVLLCAPCFALIQLGSSVDASGKARHDYNAKVVALLAFLQSQEYAAPGGILLANPSIGPAIMYHTSLNAVGTLNHNNARGIIDTYHILNAPDDTAAYELINTRGIDYLLVDDPLTNFAADRIDSSRESRDPLTAATFLGRLSLGQIPAWLVLMPVPEELADTFSLYRIRTEDAGSGLSSSLPCERASGRRCCSDCV